MTERVRPTTGLHQAHRTSGFWEADCPHHAFGCPSWADRIGAAIAWTVIFGALVYFGAHLLAAGLR